MSTKGSRRFGALFIVYFKERTMKKLGVILLAMAFVFGLAIQAGAAFEWVTDESVFAGDEFITFDDVLPWGTFDPESYLLCYEEQGVESIVGYGDNLSHGSLAFFGSPSVTNLFLPDMGGSYHHTAITVNFAETITRVGFDAAPHGSTITVKAFRDGAQTYEDSYTLYYVYPTTIEKFIGIEDLDGIDAIEISGNFEVVPSVSAVFIDNLIFGGTPDTGPEYIDVDVHIKPPNCIGAPINVKSQGVTPVVIAGSEDFDVTLIDPDSIELEGATPVRSDIEYASLCNDVKGDGELDLALKFNTQDLINGITASLGEGETLQDGHMVALHLTGYLYDLTPIREKENSVRVTVLVKGKQDKEDKGKGKNK
jgi:hypothetical protein